MEQIQTRYIVQATWDDAPHLTEKQKAELWASIPPYQRDARSKGIPMIGSGAIYPVADEDIEIDDFPIPSHWPRAYALDVGWSATAAIWGAYDAESDCVYFYSEYKRGEKEPAVHAAAIKGRGEWMAGVIDPSSRGRGTKDGDRLFYIYRDQLELDIHKANTAIEAGLTEVWLRMSSGRLKVFKSLRNTMAEKRIYRRDEKGNIVKKFDHLMDCIKYWCMTVLQGGLAISPLEIAEQEEWDQESRGVFRQTGRNRTTGY